MTKKSISLLCFLCIYSVCFAKKVAPYTFYKTDSKHIFAICLTKNDSMLAVGDNKIVKVFSTKSAALVQTFPNGHRERILSVDISKDSTLMVSAGKDSSIVLWDFIHPRIVRTLKFHRGVITSVKISPDGKYLLSGGSDHRVVLYDIKKDKIIKEFMDHHSDVTSVSFSLDGQRFLSTGGDGLVCIYSLSEMCLIDSFNEGKIWIRDACFSKDGNHVLTCNDRPMISTWLISASDKEKAKPTFPFSGNWLTSLDLSEDDQILVYGSIAGDIEVRFDQRGFIGKVGMPINRILLLRSRDEVLQFVVSTFGNGVLLMNASTMETLSPENKKIQKSSSAFGL